MKKGKIKIPKYITKEREKDFKRLVELAHKISLRK